MNKIFSLKTARTSIMIFGIYLVLFPGLALIFTPDFILDIFTLNHGLDWQIRMVGLMAAVIGGYYILIANYGYHKLYSWTVAFRIGASIFMTLLWLIGEVGIGILFFASLDMIGALWTLGGLSKGK